MSPNILHFKELGVGVQCRAILQQASRSIRKVHDGYMGVDCEGSKRLWPLENVEWGKYDDRRDDESHWFVPSYGIVTLLDMKDYWSSHPSFNNPNLGANIMSRGKVLNAINHSHLADNEWCDSEDPMYKIRPLLNTG
ncbi:hypothetical protein KIN20_024858 [Parelaphostrongylus tenuis]|uniref:Uncharacterized protein n=1 Tax=Parelaphostrongylus tenuis TaxID=148309 RepID=A0AAD5QTY5_PARTN|nr:hypothetical protein KIN20_024855 [Parelaphostrongylus tenuis]KAJ1364711.1 hypothetical protein KIN20_024858 [Parelaphostrongylus tenuis]